MEFIIIGVVIVVILGWFFSGSSCRIDYELQQSDAQNDQGGMTEVDFTNYGDLKRMVAKIFEQFACPACGGRRVSGAGVIVKYGKVHLYRQEAYRGWFGGTHYKEVFVQTVWRIHQIGLKHGEESSLLDEGVVPGQLECQASGCNWKEQGPILPAQSLSQALGIEWYSINDIMQGKLWRR